MLFHSSCAVSVTLISKSALNGIEAPVTLLALQTFVQVVLLTLVGKPLGWIKFSRPLSVSDMLSDTDNIPILTTNRHGKD